MPIFHVRLEDADSGEFRQGACEAADAAEARRIYERLEARHVGYTLTDDQLAELELLEKVAAGAVLSDDESDVLLQLALDGRAAFGGGEKARLYAHRQAKPYTIVSVKKAG